MNVTILTKAILIFGLVLGAECLCTGDDDQRQNCTESDATNYFSTFCHYIIINANSIDPDAVVELFCTDCRQEILGYLCDCHNNTNSSSPQEFVDLCTSLGYLPTSSQPTTNTTSAYSYSTSMTTVSLQSTSSPMTTDHTTSLPTSTPTYLCTKQKSLLRLQAQI